MAHSKKPKITVKEAKLIKGVVDGKTKRQAAKDAGYSGSPETLSVTASEVLKKPNVQEAFMQAMTDAGISADVLAQTLANGLRATKGVIVRDMGALDTEESRNSAFYQEMPDHSIRHKYLETSLKVAGVLNNPEAASVVNNFIYVMKSDKETFFDADPEV